MRLTGAGIVEWLERSSNVFLRADPALRTAQPLIDPKSPGYNFDTISGLTWEIDITQPRRYEGGKLVAADSHRIRDVRFEGKPIDPAREFVVVTNNYRADGGGGFPGLGGDAVILRAPDANRDALLRRIAASQRVVERATRAVEGHETDPCPLDHPLIGRLRCGEWLLWAGVHDLLHLEQLEAIDRGDTRPGAAS